MAAANITELDIVIPDQPIWTDHDIELLKAVNGTKVSRGSALAWLGHLSILRWFLSTELDTVLILEDDVDWDIRLRSAQIPKVASSMRHLTAGATTRDASSLLTHLNPLSMTDRNVHPDEYWGPKDSWDVLYLGHCGDMVKPKQWNFRIPRTAFRDETLPDIEDLHPFTRDFLKNINIPTQTRIVHKSMSPLCTFGFALTRQAARRMLYDIAPHEKTGGTAAYDVRMLEACRDLGLKCFTSNPELFHHMDVPSEIEGIDKVVKKARLAEKKAAEQAQKAAEEEQRNNPAENAQPGAPSDGQQQGDQNQNSDANSHSQAVENAVLHGQQAQQAQQGQSGGMGLVQDPSQNPPARGMGLLQEERPAIGLLKFDKRDEISAESASPQSLSSDNRLSQALPRVEDAPPTERDVSTQGSFGTDGSSQAPVRQDGSSQESSGRDGSSQASADQGGSSQGQTQPNSQSQSQAAPQGDQSKESTSSQDRQSQAGSSQGQQVQNHHDQSEQDRPQQNQQGQSYQEQSDQGRPQQDPPPTQDGQSQPAQAPPSSEPHASGQTNQELEDALPGAEEDLVGGVNVTQALSAGDEADKGKTALGFGKDEEGRLLSPIAGRAPNIRCGARSRTFYTKDAKTLEFLREVVGRQGQCLRDMIEEDMARVPVLVNRRERSWPY